MKTILTQKLEEHKKDLTILFLFYTVTFMGTFLLSTLI